MATKKIIQQIREIGKLLLSSQKNWDKLVSGNSVPGTRAVPAKNSKNDQHYGLRIDFGEKHKDDEGNEYINLNLQPNKEAKDHSIRKLAQDDPHQIIAQVRLPLKSKNPDDPEHREKAIQDFTDALVEDAKNRMK